MKLLITGATGFVGRTALLDALPRYETIWAPVRDEGKLRKQVAAEGVCDPANLIPLSTDPERWPELDPDHAILSAGVLFGRTKEEYFATNVRWVCSLVRKLPARCRVVILSSQAAGGPTPEGQAARSERDEDRPITWYGESKLALEQAVKAEFPGRSITILRPPMVLGARDQATLPLFQMARGWVRIKPGCGTKTFSFLAVDDLVRAIYRVLEQEAPAIASYYVSASSGVTDWELIQTAAETAGAQGRTLPLPQPLVRLAALLVDAVPSLRRAVPSLTRDRVRDIWPARWVVDGARFEAAFGWKAGRGLRETLQATHDDYKRRGLL